MRRVALILALIATATLAAPTAHAQTTLTAPQVAACPSPVPPNWPPATCGYQFYPLTDTVHVVASVSKTAPVYAHTYPAYSGGKFTGVLVACPKGATLSADTRQCLDAAGKDASGLVASAGIAAFALTPPTPPPPPPPAVDYTAIVNMTIEHSYDGGTTWDPISTTITYPQQAVAHCFRIVAHRRDGGDGPGQVVCPKPK